MLRKAKDMRFNMICIVSIFNQVFYKMQHHQHKGLSNRHATVVSLTLSGCEPVVTDRNQIQRQ